MYRNDYYIILVLQKLTKKCHLSCVTTWVQSLKLYFCVKHLATACRITSETLQIKIIEI